MKETISKRVIFTLTAIIVALALSLVSLAWFYFPTSQNVNLASDEKKDVDVELYKMELVGTEQLFQAVSPAGNPEVLTFSHNWSLFQWGDEYILENDAVQYFALLCTCDTEVLTAGKVALALDVTVRCTSNDLDDAEEQTYYLPVDFVSLEYAVVKSNINSYTVTSQAASVQARTMEDEAFTSISLTDDNTQSDDQYLVRHGIGTYTYVEILDNSSEPIPYFTKTTGTIPDTIDQFRSVIIVKLTADAEIVTNALNAFRLAEPELFDGLIEIDLINTITVNCNLRTVPVKTETEGG